MVTTIKNQPPSVEVRAQLAAEGKPVLVAFSAGKDSIATALALREAGVETELAHLWYVPGLRFVEEGISRLEDQLGQRVHQYPHPSFYRWLNSLVFQPPERCELIERFSLPSPTYEQMWAEIRVDLGMDPKTWVADGVRAADSIAHRAALSTHGVMKERHRKCSPIADWLIADIRACIARHGVDLPIDYEWFGRSFDGLDHRFIGPIAKHAPDDLARILEWFPLADLELARAEMLGVSA